MEKALNIRPDYAEAHWAFAMMQVPVVCGNNDDLTASRLAFSSELEKLDKVVLW